MATLGSTLMTMVDWAKLQNPDNTIASVVNLLAMKNPILKDLPFREGNLPNGHQTTVLTGLPTVYWRLVNQGTANSKSSTAQITETSAMLSARSQVDEKIARMNGDVNALRAEMAAPFVEAMAQEMASTLFYGNSSVSPEEFNGLHIRYSSTSVESGDNIILGGGAGNDNMSIWFVNWGSGAFGVYPKGSTQGLQHTDIGIDDALDGNNLPYRAYKDLWEWELGLVVPDWRNIVRICNIDKSDLIANAGSEADITELMIKAYHTLPDGALPGTTIYMGRTIAAHLDLQRKDGVAAGGGISFANIDGENRMTFRGIPIRVCDALLESEDTIS